MMNMQQSMSLKPQDVALLVKILSKEDQNWRQVDLAMELGISQGEIAKSLSRLKKIGFIYDEKKPVRAAALEFLIHGFKYVFPVEFGQVGLGVPTAISAPAHYKMVVQSGEDVYVWPMAHGKKRGQSIMPLYPNLAEAVLKDQKFYDLMSAIEILRVGRAREKNLAIQYLQKQLRSS